jgi:ParB/RepB/Spo0J family partition protein
MGDQGQLQPIVVRPRKDGGYWLVAGLHRFEAAKKLKWKEINCTIFDGMAADEADLAEIDENLIRAELSPAERALPRPRGRSVGQHRAQVRARVLAEGNHCRSHPTRARKCRRHFH